MSLRPIASGTISFGLVAIPVKLYSTSESSQTIRFNMIHEKCGRRVKYRYDCPTDGEIVAVAPQEPKPSAKRATRGRKSKATGG